VGGLKHEMRYPMEYQPQQTSSNDNQKPDNNGPCVVSSITNNNKRKLSELRDFQREFIYEYLT